MPAIVAAITYTIVIAGFLALIDEAFGELCDKFTPR